MFSREKIEAIRNDFPMFKNVDKAFFDSAATTYKPQSVIDAVSYYYTHESVNIGRGDYMLAHNTEEKVENVRSLVADFINANKKEIIFTSGASESLNVVANAYGRKNLKPNDVILMTKGEHASNILPWFKVAKEVGAIVEYVDLDSEGRLTVESFKKAMHNKVKVVAVAHVTNVLGNILPIKEITEIAHSYGAIVAVDGAQSVPHFKTDVKDLNIDFLSFSAHKMLGPTGVGVLFGKYEILENMDTLYEGGGSNARYDICGNVSYKKPPHKFEAGTMPIEGILGFGEAIKYIEALGIENIEDYEQDLLKYMLGKLNKLDNIIVYNPKADSGIIAFNVKGIFSQDVSTYLDSQGVMVRSGHHCSKVIGDVIHAADTVRASIYFYNNKEDVDKLISALKTTTVENCIGLFI